MPRHSLQLNALVGRRWGAADREAAAGGGGAELSGTGRAGRAGRAGRGGAEPRGGQEPRRRAPTSRAGTADWGAAPGLVGRDLREAERRGEAPERPNLPRPCRRRERRHEAMSWAAELLQITQQCDTTTSDRAAAASLDAVVAGLGAAARLELDAGLGADALAAQLLACGGGPAAGGQGGWRGAGGRDGDAREGCAARGCCGRRRADGGDAEAAGVRGEDIHVGLAHQTCGAGVNLPERVRVGRDG